MSFLGPITSQSFPPEPKRRTPPYQIEVLCTVLDFKEVVNSAYEFEDAEILFDQECKRMVDLRNNEKTIPPTIVRIVSGGFTERQQIV